MIEKAVNGRGEAEVTFRVMPQGQVPPIRIAGDFSGWEPLLLRPDGEGFLSVTVRLPVRRRYGFRYQDGSGRWFNDERADDDAPNAWGGVNGVVEV